MLMRTDPLREFDRIAQQFFGSQQPGTWSRPVAMPLDAYRSGDSFLVAFDLPGVSPDAIDVHVERDVLTVKAERRPLDIGSDVQAEVSERPLGVFSRQLFLGEALDTDRIQASYDNGVLLLKIPVAEQAKPRKVQITTSGGQQAINA